jgi:hypothetical protein
MLPITDEEFMNYVKSCEGEVYTMAEIHKVLIQNNINATIDEVRSKILPLHRDGYIGKELTNDGVNMYYILFNPLEYINSNNMIRKDLTVTE